MIETTTTIAAISTAIGESGIGIVRMSGPRSLDILKAMFVTQSGKPIELEPRKMCYGFVKEPATGRVIDEVLCVYMKAPHTYTKEDLVEIQCHGSSVSLKKILSTCLSLGAVLAERGEFTKRAFLNGRIDLAQAEAVIDLIKAKTDRSFDVALMQARGGLSESVTVIRDGLKELLVSLSVNMDYPDEDIEVLTYKRMEESLVNAQTGIKELLSSADEGRIVRDGLGVTIIGKPNVGKSSLMNLILKENRSIVTDIPGTTRDTIEEQLELFGIPIRITDTAGIRESIDPVEAIGVERSKEAFNRADLILFVLDSSCPLSREDEELCSMIGQRPCIAVLNKTDLPSSIDDEAIKERLPEAVVVRTCFKEGKGLGDLKKAIEAVAIGGGLRAEESLLVTNVRHMSLIEKAAAEVDEALSMVRANEAMDFIDVNVRAAFDYLGEITGDTATDEIIDEVFSRFCLGK